MSNRRKPRKNAPRANRHLHSVPARDHNAPENQPLIQMLRPALRTGDPIDFLAAISTLVAATSPPRFELTTEPDRPTLSMLVETFIEVPLRETTAALRVLRHLVTDEEIRGDIDTALATRRQPVPPWITALDETAVIGVVNSVEELGDGENVSIAFVIPGEAPITMVTFIDHNLGSAAKDAFPFPGDHRELAAVTTAETNGELIVRDLDPALARARLEEALERADTTLGMPTSETWPQSRAWLEWLIRLLPAGGTSDLGDVWSEYAIAGLAEDFVRSPEATGLKHRDTADMVETLAWLHGDDPMRWSPIVVEVLLTDRLPRKVIDTPKNMARYPTVLRAFIQYCHRVNGISAESTAETLCAVDEREPEFLDRVRGRSRAGGGRSSAPLSDPSAMVSEYLRRAIEDGHDPAEVMNSIIGRSVDELDYDADYPSGTDGDARRAAMDKAMRRVHAMTYDSLAVAVGGEDVLRSLDTAPLPDEPFAWDGVPSDARGPVGDVLALCDQAADELFDVEHRTAMRRFLACAACEAPEVFLRNAAPERLAAAVAWTIAVGNHTVGTHRAAVMATKDLLSHFGVKGSVSQRAKPLLRANGADGLGYAQGVMSLGRPDVLTSARRRHIAHWRDRSAPDAPLD